MPQEGRVQVADVSRRFAFSGEVGARIMEIGARGEAVRLLAIHTSVLIMEAVNNTRVGTALSSNPEHLATPPPTIDLILQSKAIYGFSLFNHQRALVTSGGNDQSWVTLVIPLYGLVRPRRQVLLFGQTAGTAGNIVRVEVYYQPLELAKVELDALNLKYGKYRRGA